MENALVPVFDADSDPEAVAQALHSHAASAPGPCRLLQPVFIHDFPRSPLGKPLRANITAMVRKNFET
jgi:hypothetical protein